MSGDASIPVRPPRRLRYRGKNPRRFTDKYKERDAQRYPETIERVLASGKTPAGMHRPIMVAEILEALAPQPGQIVVDCTLGYGGHAQEILLRLQPGGRLLGLDVDPIELLKTEARLHSLGYGPEEITAYRSNFAGLPQVLAKAGFAAADLILADLGVSSMQLDDPARGFSFKHDGSLDMRMNPARGQSAAEFLGGINAAKLARVLEENADEPQAERLAAALAGKSFATTLSLGSAVRDALPRLSDSARDLTVRRVFQALRIAVNDEFSSLDAFLRVLPLCLNPGGRAAVLTFHSGEDRRVKKSFLEGQRAGVYCEISEKVIRPSAEERTANPRSASAKLRWARKALA
jgi:16S rRNA (cytosine1402-N4)-methyltransferase